MKQTHNPLLHGIVPPLVTPLRQRDELDLAGLERLLEHVIGGGVHGVFVLGTTGEGPSLSYRLRRDMITQACRIVAHRVPVLVGITDTALVEAAALAHHAAEVGADALVSSAPYYFPTGQAELAGYVQQLLRELPLPLYLYNMPLMTKLQFEPDTLKRLAQLEGIVGLKDSSGDLDYFRQVIQVAKARPDWRLFMGTELLLTQSLRMGGHGGVTGGALVAPRLLVGLYEATLDKDETRVVELQARLQKLGRIYQVGKDRSSVLKGLKCALSLMSICSDLMAEPLTRFETVECQKVRALLEEMDLLGAKVS